MRWLVLLALAACAAPAPPPGVRDLSRPVYSIAGFDPARLSGDWVQVAGFGPCLGGWLSADGSFDLCLPSGRVSGVARPSAVPGRLTSKAGEIWVLWADADDRTLVIGAPDGRVGAVLDRGLISADRMKAARDILAFNGYDVSTLQTYAPRDE